MSDLPLTKEQLDDFDINGASMKEEDLLIIQSRQAIELKSRLELAETIIEQVRFMRKNGIIDSRTHGTGVMFLALDEYDAAKKVDAE